MSRERRDRRQFLKSSITTAAGLAWVAGRASQAGAQTAPATAATPAAPARPARIKFAVIGINHNHINGQVDSVKRGGGQLVSFYAKEADLAAAFAKRYPEAKLARSDQEILDDPQVKLVVSASIPNERGPLGIQVMKHGKDFMVDKPGLTTLEQLAEARRVQADTKRI
ncbi:MAG TPA: Gfo/Idh/MocA family oxidoreductase, partial [Vicinamibacteria bacterium]|nr:Gfo/Idh/MocA family oxidoreductase [Vicinamibacteria bacterium]